VFADTVDANRVNGLTKLISGQTFHKSENIDGVFSSVEATISFSGLNTFGFSTTMRVSAANGSGSTQFGGLIYVSGQFNSGSLSDTFAEVIASDRITNSDVSVSSSASKTVTVTISNNTGASSYSENACFEVSVLSRPSVSLTVTT
jgi:hypothetical protein